MRRCGVAHTRCKHSAFPGVTRLHGQPRVHPRESGRGQQSGCFHRPSPAPLAVVWLGSTGAPHSGPVSQEDPQAVALCDVPPKGYMGACGIQGQMREDEWHLLTAWKWSLWEKSRQLVAVLLPKTREEGGLSFDDGSRGASGLGELKMPRDARWTCLFRHRPGAGSGRMGTPEGAPGEWHRGEGSETVPSGTAAFTLSER